MKHVRIFAVAAAALLVFAACKDSEEAEAAFPAPTEGNAIATQPIVDINKGAEPPMLYTQDFRLQECTFKPHGVSPYYDPLVPGFESVSEINPKIEKGVPVAFRKTYRVVDETKKLNIGGIGKLEAAIVEEKEFANGKQIQVSYNWYSICEQTNSVYAFGEDSFELHPDTGQVLNTEGSWLAGTKNIFGEVAVPSLAMAGNPALGARTIFDGAPGVALGGAEVVALLSTSNGKLTTVATKSGYPGQTDIPIPITKLAGEFHGCVQIEEISQVSETRRPDFSDLTNKVWCPGVGLVWDTSDGALLESSALEDDEFQKKLAQFKNQ